MPEIMHEGGKRPARPANFFFRGGFRQAKCHVVAQTQGYHLVYIWGSLVKFHGSGVVVKFDVSALLCSLFVLFASKQ